MLRKHQPKAIGLIGLMLAAMMVVAAFGATVAQAEGGPRWIVLLGEVLHELAAGEKEAFTSSGGVTTLESGETIVESETETDTGEIIGGNPGTDLATIIFHKSHLQGHATCVATSAGETSGNIKVEVKTMLVYPHEKAGETAQAYDAFFPDNNETGSNLFVEFTLTGGLAACGLLNNLKVDVNATGTLVTDPSSINKKCGVLALVGTLTGGAFASTASGVENLVGALNAEGLAGPTLATWWMPSEKTFLLMECLLEAFGLESFQSGISDINLVANNQFGWEI